ncbi:NUDIX hydrolase [Cellulomonas shaoxiangyii]|uniref:CoA pyrophosphatase n=1 Tax=Cellulomonas shaoxiangyii TaxID=2566013 RepID=A0A4P7SRD9_9CELL|nr:CoA pyrophosphatase [Cellulomonas shaoxiangyii]QCB95313.1 CoA pyrophosphatase [Cellulomonas shaoxiangyii]TGY84939.1 CoA pyrophosphatase [Cellulomonas shaoxiangyii]
MVAAGVRWPGDPTGLRLDPARVRRAAVLVLFGVLDSVPAHERNDGHVPADLDVLLQRRATTLGHHPGQVAFPGGGIDADDDGPVGAALREAVEETGLEPGGVEVLGTLGDVPLPVSNNVVTPVVGWWTTPSRVAAVDHREAVDVFRAPVADLLDPARRAVVVHPVPRGRTRTPAFELDGGVLVWGFTAIVLSGIFDALGWTVPWDEGRTVTP